MKTKIDWKQYEKRVKELESEGLCTSDAQSVADVEFAEASTPRRRPSGASEGPWTDSTGIHGSGWDEAGANARLIAAAPDLLEALRRLTHPMASDNDLSHALALIEKVERRVA